MKPQRLPAWAWVLLAWAALVAAGAALEAFTGRPVELCLFRRVTGYPCPTCGSTRSVVALLHGDLGRSFHFSPLLWVAGVLAAAWLLVRVLRGPRAWASSPAARRWGLGLGLAALLANWVWVLRRAI